MRNQAETMPWVTYVVSAYILVSVGRIQELIAPLAYLPIGKIILLFSLFGLLFCKLEPAPKQPEKTTCLLIIVFFILSTVSIFFSVWRSHSLEIFNSFVGTMLLFYLIHKTANSMSIVKVYFKALTISAGVLSLFTIQLKSSGRLSVSSTYDPNDLAMVLVTILPITFMQFLSAKGLWRIIFTTSIISGVIAIVLTGSRGGFLGLIAVSIFLMLQKLPDTSEKLKARFSIKKVLFLGTAFLLLVLLTPHSYWERIDTIFSIQNDYNVTGERGRIAIWGQGIEMIILRPWGVGIGAFPAAQGMLMGGYYQTAHNSFIQIGGELGVAGLFIFFLFYHAAWKALKTNKSDEKNEKHKFSLVGTIALRGAFIGFLITSFFLSQGYAALFYVLLSITSKFSALKSRTKI